MPRPAKRKLTSARKKLRLDESSDEEAAQGGIYLMDEPPEDDEDVFLEDDDGIEYVEEVYDNEYEESDDEVYANSLVSAFNISNDSDKSRFYEYIKTFNLKEEMMKSCHGIEVYCYYQKYRKFDEPTYRQFMQFLLEIMFSWLQFEKPVYYCLSKEYFDTIADKIMALFPKEDKPTFYADVRTISEYQTDIVGRIPEIYYKKVGDLRSLGLVPPLKRKKRLIRDGRISKRVNYSAAVDDAQVIASLEWLKNSTGTWEEIEYHWVSSRPNRLEEFANFEGDIDQLMTIYPALKLPRAASLIVVDYNSRFNNFDNLYNKWPDYSVKLQNSIKKKLKGTFLTDLITYIDSPECSEDSRNIILFYLFPITYPYTHKLRAPDNKSPAWKPSAWESVDGFVHHIKIPSQIGEAIKSQQSFLKKKGGFSYQPTIIVVGANLKEISAIYVSIDDEKYRMENMLEAVDTCYKMCNILNAAYPAHSEKYWIAIQHCIYNFKCKEDNNTRGSLEIIKDWNSS